ncbi:MAG: Crp/Fnr family transcriptional regulator [Woeseiaceae bacterium]
MAVTEDPARSIADLSGALAPLFRGRFCDVLLPNRNPVAFVEDEVIYDLGDRERTFFFILHGVVKIGTITHDGSEIIFDIRKDGDVVGELCTVHTARPDRAVTLERTQAVAVTLDEIISTLGSHPALLGEFLAVFCDALSAAYDQVRRLSSRNVEQRLMNVLQALAQKHGRLSGKLVEIPTYLTQEELSQMVSARRERVSTALNSLRRRGIAQYSTRGHLLVDLEALEKIASGNRSDDSPPMLRR